MWEVFSAACKTALKMNRQLLESHALGPRGLSGGRGLDKAIVETWLLFFLFCFLEGARFSFAHRWIHRDKDILVFFNIFFFMYVNGYNMDLLLLLCCCFLVCVRFVLFFNELRGWSMMDTSSLNRQR